MFTYRHLLIITLFAYPYISFHIHAIQTFFERAINVGDEVFVDYGYDTDGSDWHPAW